MIKTRGAGQLVQWRVTWCVVGQQNGPDPHRVSSVLTEAGYSDLSDLEKMIAIRTDVPIDQIMILSVDRIYAA